jgi:predicted RNase H-like HicB family nuclease
MSAKSKTTSGRSKALDRPFDPDVWRRATEIARRYQVVMWFEDGDYYGRGLELPGVMADGKTPDACMEQTREALTVAVATLLEDNEAPPPPQLSQSQPAPVRTRIRGKASTRRSKAPVTGARAVRRA